MSPNAEQEHSYSVRSKVDGGGLRHMAVCPCGHVFEWHMRLMDAGLDGIDHVRAVEGLALRRAEIAEDEAAKKVLSRRSHGR